LPEIANPSLSFPIKGVEGEGHSDRSGAEAVLSWFDEKKKKRLARIKSRLVNGLLWISEVGGV
jgi:hypothetical protein